MVRQKHVDGDDDDDDDGYEYTPAACIEHHGDYDYAPASFMYVKVLELNRVFNNGGKIRINK